MRTRGNRTMSIRFFFNQSAGRRGAKPTSVEIKLLQFTWYRQATFFIFKLILNLFKCNFYTFGLPKFEKVNSNRFLRIDRYGMNRAIDNKRKYRRPLIAKLRFTRFSFCWNFKYIVICLLFYFILLCVIILYSTRKHTAIIF